MPFCHRIRMRKLPATFIVISLLTTVASLAAIPVVSTASKLPSMVINVSTEYGTYSLDSASIASLFLSPERTIPAIVHGLQESMAADRAAEPVNEHGVIPGESVHITHTVENQAVTVSIEITVIVGEGATVEHSTITHPPEHEPRGPPDIQLPVYLPTE